MNETQRGQAGERDDDALRCAMLQRGRDTAVEGARTGPGRAMVVVLVDLVNGLAQEFGEVEKLDGVGSFRWC